MKLAQGSNLARARHSHGSRSFLLNALGTALFERWLSTRQGESGPTRSGANTRRVCMGSGVSQGPDRGFIPLGRLRHCRPPRSTGLALRLGFRRVLSGNRLNCCRPDKSGLRLSLLQEWVGDLKIRYLARVAAGLVPVPKPDERTHPLSTRPEGSRRTTRMVNCSRRDPTPTDWKTGRASGTTRVVSCR